jgi:hypothetical protein
MSNLPNPPPPFRRTVRVGGVLLAAALLLSGCDTFGLGGGGTPVPAARALDYRADDLASLVVALDLPAELQPVPGRTTARFDVTTETKGERHVKASLVRADGDLIDAGLPPPGSGRTYYLLGFSARDAKAVADAQKWLAGLPVGAPPVIAFNVSPSLCETAAIDPAATTFSILPALPGAGPLVPLVSDKPLTMLLNGGQVPPCGSV